MGMKSFDCPDQDWEKALDNIQKTKYDSISEALREKIRDVADIEIEETEKETKFLDEVSLSDKQEKLFRKLIEEKVSKNNARQLMAFCEENNIYDRKDYVKRAVQKIDKSFLPYNSYSGGVKSQKMKCSCKTSFNVTALSNSDGKCPNCGKNFIDFTDDMDKGFEVVQ